MAYWRLSYGASWVAALCRARTRLSRRLYIICSCASVRSNMLCVSKIQWWDRDEIHSLIPKGRKRKKKGKPNLMGQMTVNLEA